jgi:hypothetical protein
MPVGPFPRCRLPLRVQRPHTEDGSRAATPLLRGEAAAAVSGAEEGLLCLRARAAPCLRRR